MVFTSVRAIGRIHLTAQLNVQMQHLHLKDWREKGWKEEPSSIYPMLGYANIHDESLSLSFLSKGIKEYEITGRLHCNDAIS